MDSDEEDFEFDSGSESDFDGDNSTLSPPVQATSTSIPKPDPRLSRLTLQKCLPYEVETLAEMDERLEVIVARLLDCVEAREWDVGFALWSRRLTNWLSLKYPLPRTIRAKLANLYYELATMPGLDANAMGIACGMVMTLLKPKKLISIADLRLDWRPLHEMLVKELFPKRRKANHTNISTFLLDMAEVVQRFFHPSEYKNMLEKFLPRLSSDIDSILSTQAFIVHFLPLSHPQLWLPVLMKIWEGINSGLFDDQMLDLLAQLTVGHVKPSVSDPKRLESIPKGRFNEPKEKEMVTNGNGKGKANGKPVDEVEMAPVDVPLFQDPDAMDVDEDGLSASTSEPTTTWPGIRKEVGLLSADDFQMVMVKCLRSMATPVGGALTSAISAGKTPVDATAGKTVLQMSKPSDKLHSLSMIIVYSMAEDGPSSAGSSIASPGNVTPKNPLDRVKTSTEMKPSASLDSLAAAGKAEDQKKTYMAGSKALEGLRNIIQSCETFFHPSNHGSWTKILTTFVQDLAWEFARRWKEEELPDCKTPKEWRLTQNIKREFVLLLREVCYFSIFSKDMTAQSSTKSALRSLSLLEPDLVVMPILEKAIPALQGLEETGRTTAVLRALSGVSFAMVNRSLCPSASVYLASILDLCLPGIDINDPGKSISTMIFLMSVLQYVRLEEVVGSDAEGASSERIALAERDDTWTREFDSDSALQPYNEDEFKSSTTLYSDWLGEFARRLFALYDNLPEESEARESGARRISAEEQLVATGHSTLETIAGNLSDVALDRLIGLVYDYVTTRRHASAVRVINGVISALCNAAPKATFAKFWPYCRAQVKAELDAGASNRRTTATSLAAPSDTGLHWQFALCYGLLSNAGSHILDHSDDLVPFLNDVIERTYTESGYSWCGRLLERILTNLVSTYTTEDRLVNRDVWESSQFKDFHSAYWGKAYSLKDVKVDWHVPSEEDLSISFAIFDQVLSPMLDKCEALLETPSQKSKEWTNDFCRYTSHIRYIFTALNELAIEPPSAKTGGDGATAYPDTPATFVTPLPPFKSGFILTDPEAPRYKSYMAIRARWFQILHRAVAVLKVEEETSIDAVKITVRSIGTLMLSYGMQSKSYDREWKAYHYLDKQLRLYAKQKQLPRSLWIRRIELYSHARLRLGSQRRARSASDDELIGDLLDLSLSLYPRVRKIAQAQLTSIANNYDGTRQLILPRLLEQLRPGVAPDVMKGALFLLAGKSVTSTAVRDWRFIVQYIETLLLAQHEAKPSVQALIASALEGAMDLIREPLTLEFKSSDTLKKAAVSLQSALTNASTSSSDQDDLKAGMNKTRTRLQNAYEDLMAKLLSIAQKPTTHWRYQVAAAKLIKLLLRRDVPASAAITEYFVKGMIDPHPQLRSGSQQALTRILYFVKLRSLCHTQEALWLQETANPLSRMTAPGSSTPNFTEQYLANFKTSPDPRETGTEKPSWMQDKSAVGWLCWGEEIKETRLAGWEEEVFVWDAACQPALDAIKAQIDNEAFWRSLIGHWAQEKTRSYLSADNIDVVRSLCQIYGELPLIHVQPILKELLNKSNDKDPQRAFCEVLGGLVRGAKHWKGSSRAKLWDFIERHLAQMWANIRVDTFEAYRMFFEHVLYQRDPRRMTPLVDFLLERARNSDYAGGSAFELRKDVQMLNSVLRCFQWRFSPWAKEFATLSFASVANDYVEVRNLIASNLSLLDNVSWHPSYPSPGDLIKDCMEHPEKDIMGTRGSFGDRMAGYVASLPQLRAERPSGPQSSLSAYDKTSSTLTRWLYIALTDTHAPAIFEDYIIPLLPEIFLMREMLDSDELHKMAAVLLVYIVAITPPPAMVEPLIKALVKVLQESTQWKVRLHAIPILSVIYYRELPLITEELGTAIMECLGVCLKDENEDVRQTASGALSGILRCSRRGSITVLKDRFLRDLKSIKLPPRRDSQGNITQAYQTALVELHGAILGVTALIEAFPYTVPSFVPHLLTEVLADHASSPTPISTTVRACAASFQRTHADSWDKADKAKFTEDQLDSYKLIIAGTSYYA